MANLKEELSLWQTRKLDVEKRLADSAEEHRRLSAQRAGLVLAAVAVKDPHARKRLESIDEELAALERTQADLKTAGAGVDSRLDAIRAELESPALRKKLEQLAGSVVQTLESSREVDARIDELVSALKGFEQSLLSTASVYAVLGEDPAHTLTSCRRNLTRHFAQRFRAEFPQVDWPPSEMWRRGTTFAGVSEQFWAGFVRNAGIEKEFQSATKPDNRKKEVA